MKTALVADDELITRLAFSKILEEIGFSIISPATDGFDAVELCRKTHPDIVLLDLKMPVFDGSSAAERIIKEDLAESVIIISAYCDEQTVMRAVNAGVSGYLVKPVDKRQIFPAVNIAMAQKKRMRELSERTAAAENSVEEWKLIDRAKAHYAKSANMTEAEAYRQMQKLAMDKRAPLVAIARGLIESESERELVQEAKKFLMENENLSEKEAYKKLSKLAQERQCTIMEAGKDIIQKRGIEK